MPTRESTVLGGRISHCCVKSGMRDDDGTALHVDRLGGAKSYEQAADE